MLISGSCSIAAAAHNAVNSSGWNRKMEMRPPFRLAMAVALSEYRLAQGEIVTSMLNGTAYGEIWRQKQLRLDRALDVWSQLPRKYYGTEKSLV
jgi:hypothetical protein